MNRKEMLVSISNQSGCSLRKVRKVIFKRAAENKRFFPYIKFSQALVDSSTDWLDWNEIKYTSKFDSFNVFDVCNFPSGVVVLFHVKHEDRVNPEMFGARLTTTKGLYKTRRSRKE